MSVRHGLQADVIVLLCVKYAVWASRCDHLICCENGIFNSTTHEQVTRLFNTTTEACSRVAPVLPTTEPNQAPCSRADTEGIHDFQVNVSGNRFRLSWNLDGLQPSNETSWQYKVSFHFEGGHVISYSNYLHYCQYLAFLDLQSVANRGGMYQDCEYKGAGVITLHTFLFSLTRPACVGLDFILPENSDHSPVVTFRRGGDETEDKTGAESHTTELVVSAVAGTILVAAIITITVVYTRKKKPGVAVPSAPNTSLNNTSITENQPDVPYLTEGQSFSVSETTHVSYENNMEAPMPRIPSFLRDVMIELNREDSFKSQLSSESVII